MQHHLFTTFLIIFLIPELLCVIKVSEINSFFSIFIPETKSPDVIPVAQKIESPLII